MEVVDEIHLTYNGDMMNLIRELELIMLERELSLALVRIDEMIKSGFLSYNINGRTERDDAELTALIDYYVDGFNPSAIEFWSPTQVEMKWELEGFKNYGYFL
jgi:hypothetical protein